MSTYTLPPPGLRIIGKPITIYNRRDADWPGYTYMLAEMRFQGLPADKIDFIDGWAFRRWFPGREPMPENPQQGWKPKDTAELVDALRCAQALVDPTFELPRRYLEPPDELRRYVARPACCGSQSINGRTGFCSNCGAYCRE